MCLSMDWIYSSNFESSSRSVMRNYKTDDTCFLCSNELFKAHHHHISTKYITKKFCSSKYFCPLCRIHHNNLGDSSGRKRVVLGSSTLHNVWKAEEFKPHAHIDFEIIIGGRIHDVNAAFLYQFSSNKTPMDIILACGINNIPNDTSNPDTAEDIIYQYKAFLDWINLPSADMAEGSRVVIATIPYAPKQCDRSLPGSVKMVEKVRKVNEWIVSYNRESTGVQLRLDLHGVVGNPSAGKDIVHRYLDWQEPQIDKKLHLNKEVKRVIAKELVQVFTSLQQTNSNKLQQDFQGCEISKAKISDDFVDKSSSRLVMKYKALLEF